MRAGGRVQGEHMRNWMVGLLLQVGVVVSASAQEQAAAPPAEPATGTLVVEVKPFRSDRELPAKAVEQLKSGVQVTMEINIHVVGQDRPSVINDLVMLYM